MRAMVADPSTPGVLGIQEVEAPVASATQALIRVQAFSLNAGETRSSFCATAAWRPGWDLAGVVVQAATNGVGPTEGTRVVGLVPSGAWAELVAVPTQSLAVLPDEVSISAAATLPVAGLTALYALEKARLLLGKNVLVTGAAGGVGRFAIQMASRSGARVIAVSRRPNLGALLQADGCTGVTVVKTVTDAVTHGPFDFALDSVGGAALAGAMTSLANGGICVNCGNSSAEPTSFETRQFYMKGETELHGLYLGTLMGRPVSSDLARLCRLVAAKQLFVPIDIEAPWTDLPSVGRKLLDQGVSGKAVLHIGT